MGKKILDSNALYVVLSVILAVFLWFYVISLDGSEETQTFTGIPVQYVGMEQLESRNLMVVNAPLRVSVRVRAMPRVLAALSSDDIVATVDVSRIEGASQLDLAYTVTYPSELAGSIQEVSRTPNSVNITIAKYTRQEIPIIGVFTGSPAEGYVAGDSEDFEFLPEKLVISGREDLVNQVYAARVTVPGDKLTESVAGDFSYELISNSGEVLDLDVECSEERIYTRFPILMTKDVPLVIKFTDGGGATEEDVSYFLDTEYITVSGSKADVDAINEIILDTLNLAEVRNGDKLTFPIPLANELTNLTGVTEVTATLSLPGLSVKRYFASRFEAINVPEGWTAEIITAALEVSVRGKPAALADISGEDIRVVADLVNLVPAEGQFTLIAKVYLDNVDTDSGIFGKDYRVVVRLALQTDEE